MRFDQGSPGTRSDVERACRDSLNPVIFCPALRPLSPLLTFHGLGCNFEGLGPLQCTGDSFGTEGWLVPHRHSLAAPHSLGWEIRILWEASQRQLEVSF